MWYEADREQKPEASSTRDAYRAANHEIWEYTQIREKDVCKGTVHLTVQCYIIPALFPNFFPISYLYILLYLYYSSDYSLHRKIALGLPKLWHHYNSHSHKMEDFTSWMAGTPRHKFSCHISAIFIKQLLVGNMECHSLDRKERHLQLPVLTLETCKLFPMTDGR